MFSHVMIGANSVDKAKAFYDKLLGAIGVKPHFQDKQRIFYQHNGNTFSVSEPINGEPATHANGGTVGFACDSPEQVDAWHKAGLEAGGTSIEEPPGLRESPMGKLYLAYLRDPDGNKLCALHRVQ